MFPYAAYLRVYEPVIAFPEPARTLWTAYADSRRRPRRIHALGVEHRQAAGRLVAAPPEVAPERESRDAYVRRSDDMIFVCPWETRLRSWLAFDRFRQDMPAVAAAAFVPPLVAERVTGEFDRWRQAGRSLRPHILTTNWHVPMAWFVPFAPAERCLLLGAPGTGYGPAGHGPPGHGPPGSGPQGTGHGRPEDGARGTVEGRTGDGAPEQHAHGPATAAPARTLIYVTSMPEARRRVEAAVPVVRGGAGVGEAVPLTAGRLETLGRWLAGFHPRALVELDYGGLVHLLDDAALHADQSVAETGVALAAMERGEAELAVAMHERLLARWRFVRALESAN